MIVKPDYELKGDQRAMPLVWVEHMELPTRPPTDTEILELAFGDGTSRKLKSWGHVGEHNAHWLVTRGGTPLHTDPAYSRYTHHLILRNDGWRLRGLSETGSDGELPPPLRVGTIYCLDAFSPHQVVPDPRLIFLGKPIYKVQAAIDTDEPLSPDLFRQLIAPMLWRDLRDGAAAAAKTAPAPRPK